MKRSGISTGRSIHQMGLFALFLLCGFLVFVLGLNYLVVIPKNLRLAYKIALSASFLAAVLLAHRNKHLRQYRQVFLAFFVASTALVFEYYHAHLGSLFLSGKESTAIRNAVMMVSSTSIIVITIVVLTKISGGSMASIYLKKGNLRLGLIIGASTFLIMSILGILWAQSQNIGMDRIIPILPYVVVFGLTNGLREELLYRGLFLGKYAIARIYFICPFDGPNLYRSSFRSNLPHWNLHGVHLIYYRGRRCFGFPYQKIG